MTIAQALFSSASQTWNTPQPVVDRLFAFDDRGCSLDPCSNDTSIVPARTTWRIERGEDGLSRPWFSWEGPAFCNPPYEDLEPWASKMAAEAARHVEIIALIPSRPDTRAFQRSILRTCTAIHFWAGRMKYGAGRAESAQVGLFGEFPPALDEGENVAPFPSCLPYWGPRPRRFLRAFESAGWGVVSR